MAISYWVREDSGAANNPALNLTGADSLQVTFDATTAGQARVEDLRASDMVETLEHGNQPIRWIGSQSFPDWANTPRSAFGLGLWVIHAIYWFPHKLMENISNYGSCARISLKPHETVIAAYTLDLGTGSENLSTAR